MSKPEAAPEPSMEDILASIRKMISEDRLDARPIPDQIARTSIGERAPAPAAVQTAKPEGWDRTEPVKAMEPTLGGPVERAIPSFSSLSDALKSAVPNAAATRTSLDDKIAGMLGDEDVPRSGGRPAGAVRAPATQSPSLAVFSGSRPAGTAADAPANRETGSTAAYQRAAAPALDPERDRVQSLGGHRPQPALRPVPDTRSNAPHVNGAHVNGANGSPVNGSTANGAALSGSAPNGAPRNGAEHHASGVNGAAHKGAAAHDGGALNGAGVNGSARNGASSLNGSGVNGAKAHGANGAGLNGAAANGSSHAPGINGSALNAGGLNGAALPKAAEPKVADPDTKAPAVEASRPTGVAKPAATSEFARKTEDAAAATPAAVSPAISAEAKPSTAADAGSMSPAQSGAKIEPAPAQMVSAAKPAKERIVAVPGFPSPQPQAEARSGAAAALANARSSVYGPRAPGASPAGAGPSPAGASPVANDASADLAQALKPAVPVTPDAIEPPAANAEPAKPLPSLTPGLGEATAAAAFAEFVGPLPKAEGTKGAEVDGDAKVLEATSASAPTVTPTSPFAPVGPSAAGDLKGMTASRVPSEMLVDAVMSLVQEQPSALSVLTSGSDFIHGIHSALGAVKSHAAPDDGAGAGEVGAPSPGPAKLDSSAAELLRPMLRQWLAENMPRIVEDALRSELMSSQKPASPVSDKT